MAFAYTQLANYNENSASRASLTTASLSIPADCFVFVFVHAVAPSSAFTSTVPFTVTNSTEGATGWTQVGAANYKFDSSAFPDQAGQVFYKYFATAVSRTITIAFSPNAQPGYEIAAVTGMDSASPIVQYKALATIWNDGGNSHTHGVTLDATPASGNALLWFMGGNNDGNAAATLPTGFTALSLPSAPSLKASGGYNNSPSSATVTCPDCGDQVQTAYTSVVEIKAASAAPTPNGRFFALF